MLALFIGERISEWKKGGFWSFGYVFMVWLIGNAVLKVISICIQKTFDAAWLHSENRTGTLLLIDTSQ